MRPATNRNSTGSVRGAIVMLACPTFSDRGTVSSMAASPVGAQGTIAFSSVSIADTTSAPTPPILRSLRDAWTGKPWPLIVIRSPGAAPAGSTDTMNGMRPITNGAGFEGSEPIETTTGSDVPTVVAASGTRTLRLVAVASSTAAGRSPNFTVAPAPQSVPASVTSSPGHGDGRRDAVDARRLVDVHLEGCGSLAAGLHDERHAGVARQRGDLDLEARGRRGHDASGGAAAAERHRHGLRVATEVLAHDRDAVAGARARGLDGGDARHARRPQREEGADTGERQHPDGDRHPAQGAAAGAAGAARGGRACAARGGSRRRARSRRPRGPRRGSGGGRRIQAPPAARARAAVPEVPAVPEAARPGAGRRAG